MGNSLPLDAEAEKRANIEKRKVQKAHEKAVRERWAEEARQERANNASTARWKGLVKIEEAKKQARINDANAARWAGLAAMEQKKEEAKKAQEQAAFDHRTGEHTGEQDKVAAWKEESWLEKANERLYKTWTSGTDWISRAIQAIPDTGRAILLAPVQIFKKINGKYTFPINEKMMENLSSLASKVGISIPSDSLEYRKMLLDKTGFDTILSVSKKKAGGIGPHALLNRIKDGLKNDWAERVGNFTNGLSDITGRFKSIFTKNAAMEVVEETAEAAVEEVSGATARSGFGKLFKSVSPGILDTLVDTSFNIYDYTFGDKKNETDKIQKIIVSSGVDIGGSLLTGAVAAGTVAGIVAGLALAGVTAPIWITVGATIGIGIALDIALEWLGWKEPIKVWANQQWDKAEPTVKNWWSAAFNSSSPTPAQPPIPAPLAPIATTPQDSPSTQMPSETPTATPSP